MKEKVLLLILDGFSSKYLKKDICPNICAAVENNYYSPIESLFGFKGIGAAIFSGALMNQTHVFSEYVINEQFTNSNFYLEPLFRLTDFIPNDLFCSTSRQVMLRLIGKGNEGISNVIPSHLINAFSPKVSKPLYVQNALGKTPTIFDILRSHHMGYFYCMPSVRTELKLFDFIVHSIKESKLPYLTVIHPCSIDMKGHDFGPKSERMRNALSKMDKNIQEIIHSIQKSGEKITLLLISDHGMVPISNHTDIIKELRKLPLKMGKDYLVFLDSTVARFWFFNSNAQQMIYDRLMKMQSGRVLTPSDLVQLGINEIDRKYGDLFFAVKEGIAIFPDFFRKSIPPKGLHGYAYSTYDTPILIACSSDNSVRFKHKKVVRFIDLVPTILGLLGLPIPDTCHGESFRV